MIGNLNEVQIQEVLENNALGRLACSDENQPYVVPINYIYENGFIIAHSLVGRKIRMMRNNPQVCFQVDEIKNFTSWKSVVAWGEYEELTEEQEQYEAMKLFVDRILHLKISETAIPPEIAQNRLHPRSPGNIRPVVYRIKIKEWSGRYEKEEPKE